MLCQVAETVGPVSKVPGPPPVGVDLDSPYSLKQVTPSSFSDPLSEIISDLS
jgi:hypothetical protein